MIPPSCPFSDLERFVFKPRKDGSFVYRDLEKAVRLYPTNNEQWSCAIQLRRWRGGVASISVDSIKRFRGGVICFRLVGRPKQRGQMLNHTRWTGGGETKHAIRDDKVL